MYILGVYLLSVELLFGLLDFIGIFDQWFDGNYCRRISAFLSMDHAVKVETVLVFVHIVSVVFFLLILFAFIVSFFVVFLLIFSFLIFDLCPSFLL
jgi:hypothetical protein